MEVISIAEAKVCGLKHYFTGNPCKYGHVAERYVSTSACCECYARRRAANPEEHSENVRRWRAANPDKARKQGREQARRRRAAHLDKVREINRESVRRWRAANPDKAREETTRASRRWRAAHSANPINRLVASQRTRVWMVLKKGKRKSKRTMHLIGCTPQFLFEHISRQLVGTDLTWENFGTAWHIDHVWPISSFDLDNECDRLFVFNWSNLRPLAKFDNLSKHTRPPTYTEFYDHYSAFVGPAEFWAGR